MVTGIYKGSSEERKKKGGMVDAKESTIFEETSFDDEFFRLRGKEPTDPLSTISYSEREVKRGAAKAKQNAYEPMKSYRDSIVEKNRTMESRHDNRIFRGESSREILLSIEIFIMDAWQMQDLLEARQKGLLGGMLLIS